MSVKIACPNPACHTEYKVAQESLGGLATCKKCGTSFTLQLSTSDTATPSPAARVPPPAQGAAAESSRVSDAASASLPKATLLPKIGRYVVMRRLGAGAMGEVWLARDPDLERDVALKTLRREYAQDPEYLRRFLREARSAAQLHHQNTVSIYQVGAENDVAYIAMEMIDGSSLDKVLKERGPLPWREATQIIRDAALGLAVAHEIGLVHRDLKPANLMRTSKGVTKVVDFGLARAASTDSQLTQKGAMLGTPAFMAPELWAGEAADARSDLYALVLSYYQLMTGKLPYDAEMIVQVGYQHRFEPFPDPRKHVTGLPDTICRILSRGARKEPSERYQNAAALIAELNALLASPEASLTSGGAWEMLNDPKAAASTPRAAASIPNATPIEATSPAVTPTSLFDSIASAAPPAVSSTRIQGNRTSTLLTLRRHRLRIGAAVGVLLLGSFALWGLAVLQVETAEGVVIIDVNEPNPEVFVDGDHVTVSWASGGTQAEICVPPGTRRIELKKDGFKAVGEEIVIERGGRQSITAKLEPLLPFPVARLGAQAKGSESPPPQAAGSSTNGFQQHPHPAPDTISTQDQPRIDLLKLLDLSKDSVAGDWHLEGGALSCEPAESARVEFAYQPPEEYDYRLVLTRQSGRPAVAAMCYAGNHQFAFLLAGWGNTVSGFQLVDDKAANSNRTTIRRHDLSVPGRPLTLVIKVRKDRSEAYLNDEMITAIETDYHDLSMPDELRIPKRNAIGLMCNDSVSSITVAEIIEVTGHGKLLRRPAPPSLPPRQTASTSYDPSSLRNPAPPSVPPRAIALVTGTATAGDVKELAVLKVPDGANSGFSFSADGSRLISRPATQSSGTCLGNGSSVPSRRPGYCEIQGRLKTVYCISKWFNSPPMVKR